MPAPAPWLPRGAAVLGAAAVALLGLAGPARAQFTWNNPAGGPWSVGGNWLGGTAPAAGPTVALIFPNASPAGYTATNDIANPFVLNALTFDNAAAGLITVAPDTANGGALSFAG